MTTTNLIDPMVAGDDVRTIRGGAVEQPGRERDDAIRDLAVLTGDLKGLLARVRKGDAAAAAKAAGIAAQRTGLVERFGLHALAATFAR